MNQANTGVAPAPPLPAVAGPAGYSPPPGTYPAPGSPPVVPDFTDGGPPPSGKMGRRVGTFTMALSLIAVGVVLILRIFLPQLDILAVARFAPVVLILLGLELLVAHALHRQEKLRFDGLSVFISLLLIAASLVAATVPEAIWRVERAQQTNSRLMVTLNAQSHEALDALDLPDYRAEWYVNVSNAPPADDISPTELLNVHQVQFRLSLEGDYADAEAFAEDCNRALVAVLPLVPHIDYAVFQSGISPNWETNYHGEHFYFIWLDDRYAVANYPSKMADYVTTYVWAPEEGRYLNEWDAPNAPEDEDMAG